MGMCSYNVCFYWCACVCLFYVCKLNLRCFFLLYDHWFSPPLSRLHSSSEPVRRRSSARPTPFPLHRFYFVRKCFPPFSRSPVRPFSSSPMYPFAVLLKTGTEVNQSIPRPLFLPGCSQRPGSACGSISASPSSASPS